MDDHRIYIDDDDDDDDIDESEDTGENADDRGLYVICI